MSPGPLRGLRVLELARVLAGPWAGQAFADLGADVVKVESPEGDDTRRWGPPFVERAGDVSAAYFHGCNRGKRSVALDFASAEGREAVLRLADVADVVIENFKVGGLARFGLDYPSLGARNRGLVYCSVTGFGQDGPYSARPGYDYIIQGMCGLMSVTGSPADQPQKVGVAVTDVLTGLYAAIACLAALRQRDVTGHGQHIDLALLDVGVAAMANQAMNYLVTDVPPGRIGNAHRNLTPYQVFDCADGHVIIAVGNDAQFQRLCALLGVPELADAAEYRTNAARVAHRGELTEHLAAIIVRWASDALLAACEAQGIPAGPINNLAQVFADPQVRHRDLQCEIDGIPGVRPPFRFSDAEIALDRPSPALDEHGAELRRGWSEP